MDILRRLIETVVYRLVQKPTITLKDFIIDVVKKFQLFILIFIALSMCSNHSIQQPQCNIARLQNGEELPGPRRKQILKAKTYDTLLHNLMSNAIDIGTFLTAAASLIIFESSVLVTVTS
jgi:hypothetical protein